jgi:hypothetical protein
LFWDAWDMDAMKRECTQLLGVEKKIKRNWLKLDQAQ